MDCYSLPLLRSFQLLVFLVFYRTHLKADVITIHFCACYGRSFGITASRHVLEVSCSSPCGLSAPHVCNDQCHRDDEVSNWKIGRRYVDLTDLTATGGSAWRYTSKMEAKESVFCDLSIRH